MSSGCAWMFVSVVSGCYALTCDFFSCDFKIIFSPQIVSGFLSRSRQRVEPSLQLAVGRPRPSPDVSARCCALWDPSPAGAQLSWSLPFQRARVWCCAWMCADSPQ